MKKILSILTVLVIVFASLLAFAGCGDTSEFTLPEAKSGYTWFENDDIYFSYPEAWVRTELYGLIQFAPANGGNNIIITTSDYDPTFDNITVETVNTSLKPALEADGVTMSNINVVHDTKGETDIAIITYDVTYSTYTTNQTLYMFKVGEKIYSITLTEATKDASLVSTIYNSLNLK